MVNNELHDHFTRQSHFLHPRKGSYHVSTQSFSHIGPLILNSIKKNVNVLVPMAKLKITSKVVPQIISSNLITRNSSLCPYHIYFSRFDVTVLYIYIYYYVYSSFHLAYYIILMYMYEY